MELKPVFTVSELNEYVRLSLAQDPNLSRLAVTGEISGFRRPSSGHLYFSLKDDGAQVRCVMFRGAATGLDFRPEDGMQVRVVGRADLYTRDGSFQVYADSMLREGAGALYQRFLRLKAQLEQKGYFDSAHKKPIPALPRAVGVVTSGTGAALQDIRNVIGRRFPAMPVLLYHAAVQGAGAAAEIADAIKKADLEQRVDVLIVGRGGGSLEDLWAFNEIEVAEAVFGCRIPIISAVGHETDFSIADFTADLRAPTPSAAAELAVPEYAALSAGLMQMRARLDRSLSAGVLQKRQALERMGGAAALLRVRHSLETEQLRLDRAEERMLRACRDRLQRTGHALSEAGVRLDGFDPDRTLRRGFALVYDAAGAPLTKADRAAAGQRVLIRFADGGVRAKVTGKDDTDGTDQTDV